MQAEAYRQSQAALPCCRSVLIAHSSVQLWAGCTEQAVLALARHRACPGQALARASCVAMHPEFESSTQGTAVVLTPDCSTAGGANPLTLDQSLTCTLESDWAGLRSDSVVLLYIGRGSCSLDG